MKIKSNERKKDKLDLQMFSEETKKNSGSDAVKIFYSLEFETDQKIVELFE